MTSPTRTASPLATATDWRWLYVVMIPLPWSISTLLPPPHGCHPAARTTPESAAYTRVPHAAAKSWPQWNSPDSPVRGLCRSPKEELGYKTSSGAMRKPAPGRFNAADATPGDCALTLFVEATPLADVSTIVRPNGTLATNSATGPLTVRPSEVLAGSSSAGPTTPEGGTTRTEASSRAPAGVWMWLAGAWNPNAKTENPTTTAAERLRKAIRPGPFALAVSWFPPCVATDFS